MDDMDPARPLGGLWAKRAQLVGLPKLVRLNSWSGWVQAVVEGVDSRFPD